MASRCATCGMHLDEWSGCLTLGCPREVGSAKGVRDPRLPPTESGEFALTASTSADTRRERPVGDACGRWPSVIEEARDLLAAGRFTEVGRGIADHLHDACRCTEKRIPSRLPISATMRRELTERACGNCAELGRAVLRIAESRWRELQQDPDNVIAPRVGSASR